MQQVLILVLSLLVAISAAVLFVNTSNALVRRYAGRIPRLAPALLVAALWLRLKFHRRRESLTWLQASPRRRPLRPTVVLGLVAMAAFVLTPLALACPTPTVQSATACGSAGTICNNGQPYSLTALINGTQTLQAVVSGQNATYLVANDTTNTNFTLTFTGTAPTGSTQYMQCSNTIGSGTCQMTGPLGTAIEGGNYGPPTNGWTNPIVAQISYTGVPTGTNFDVTFPNFTGDSFTGSLSGACYGACQVANTCSGSGTTTVTGTVYVPNGVDPLPNALVYIPSTVPGAIPAGVECLTNGNEASGNPIAYTYSTYNGTFTLTGVPSGTNIPIVIQAGKWRMQGTISTVTACGSTAAPAWATTMPSTHVQGDIPKIAVVTGSVDAVECVLLRTGVNQTEFTNQSGTGQINLYVADHQGGASLSSSTSKESVLTHDLTLMNAYDMIMFPCQGSPADSDAAGDMDNVLDWANRGGRLFTTHYSYAWLSNNYNAGTVQQTINGSLETVTLPTNQGPATAVKWDLDQTQPTFTNSYGFSSTNDDMGTVITTFTDGSTLSSWLENKPAPYASTTPQGTAAQIEIDTIRVDQDGVNSPTQAWVTLNDAPTNYTGNPKRQSNEVVQMTFNTPVGAGAANQCGKVIYNDYHVYNGSFGSATFPNECPSGAMSDQEHLLEYALFDLTNAVTPVVGGTSVNQNFVNSPSPAFTQGDTADQITINVENDGTESLGASLQVAGVLPTGITINTSAFLSGNWSCTTSAGGSNFNCTRTTILPVGASDPIALPVAVASNAPTSPTGSLTDTISGGGLTSNVTGTDALPIQGHPVITWATPAPIVYGTPLSVNTQLDANAFCGGVAASGTYVYKYGSTTLLSGASGNLPVGNDTLTVTFTPSTITTSCPVQTATVVQQVTPAVLTVTANNQTKPYNTTNPTLTYTINAAGLVNGDSIGVVTGAPAMSTTVITSTPVGTYQNSITAALGTLAAANYTFTFVPGNFIVTTPTESISWPVSSPITYGTSLVNELDATVTANNVTVPGVCTYKNGSTVLTPTTVLPAGAYSLSVSCVPNDTTDYTTQTTTASLTVSPAPLTITANSYAIAYGAAIPSLGYAVTSTPGFVNGDTFSSLTSMPVVTFGGGTNPNAGTYANALQFQTPPPTDSNYTITWVPGTLTVNSIAGAITWATPAAINYGIPLGSAQLNATATCNGNTVTGNMVYTPPSGTVLNAGTTHALTATFTPTGPGANNCTFTPATVNQVVNKDVLQVTADNQTKAYGAANPSLTYTVDYTGLKNGDGQSVVSGTASLTTTVGTTSAAGTYTGAITFATENLAATNYTFNYNSGNFTVTPATGVINWATPAAINYGTALGSTQLNATATCNGSSVTGNMVYTPPAGTFLNAGPTNTLTVTFTPTGSGAANCTFTPATVNQVVNKDVLQVTADNQTKVFGADNPSLTYTVDYTGLKNGDAHSVVGGTATLTTTVSTSTAAGTYTGAITFATENLTATNYTFNYNPGNFTVTPAAGAINWATPAAIDYGTPLSGLQLNATATCNGTAVDGTMVYLPPSGTVLGAGTTHPLSVTFTPTGSSSCTFTSTSVNQVVNKDVLQVTADNQTKVYGAANPSLTYTINPAGLKNSDSLSVVTGTAALSTTVDVNTAAGSYPNSITVTQGTLAAANYTFNFNPGSFTVTQAAGTINWPTPDTIVYGTPLSDTQLDAKAYCNGSLVAGTMVYTPPAGTVLNAHAINPLSVTFTPTGSSSCTFAPATNNQAVTPATLVLTANNQTKVYNTANPTLTYTIAGFVNGDTQSSAVGGSPAMSTTVTTSSPVGSYPNSITAQLGTLSAANYTFTFAPGNFTVTPPAETITWAAPSPINYGTSLTGLLNASVTSGGVPVTSVCTYKSGSTAITSTTVLAAGSYTLTATCVPTDTTDYTTQTTTVPLIVNKDVLTVTANNQIMTYGAPVPTLTDTITGYVNGDTLSVVGGTATLATTGTSSSPVGLYPITFATESLTAANYTFNYVPGTLTINPAPISVTCPANNAGNVGTTFNSGPMIVTGGTAPYTFSVVGTLPGGLTLNTSTGAVTGTPTTTGTFSIKVTDSKGVVGTTTCSISITPAKPTVSCPAVNTGTVSVWFNSGPMTVNGGAAPYTYAVVGTLPAGLTLNPSNGAVTGTPTASGSFSIKVTDSKGVAGTATCPITINRGTPTGEIACWNSTFAYGYNYQCDANNDTGVFQGYMTYSYDGGAAVKVQMNSAGHALFTINLPVVGTHHVIVTYPQQGSWNAYSLPDQPFTVTPAVVKVAIAPSAYYAPVGTIMTFTVSLNTDSAGAPNKIGTVSLYDGTTLLSKVAVDATGKASFTAQGLTAGFHTITANYSGGTNFGSATGSTVIQIGGTILSWTAPAAITYGTKLSSTQLDATAMVPGTFAYSPAAGTTPAAGQQTLKVTFTPTDTKSYTVQTATVTLTVNKAPQTITLTTPASAKTSSQITLNGTGGASGNPVTYTATGPATLSGATLKFTGEGTVTVTANQAGNSNYLAATAVTQTIVVSNTAGSATITLTATNNTLTYPAQENLVACVTLPNKAMPNGTISLYDGAALLTTQPISGNNCLYWWTAPALLSGTHQLKAVYNDSSNPNVTSAQLTITVNRGTPTGEIVCYNPTFAFGNSYQCDANNDTGTFQGYMTYSYDGGAPVTVQMNSAGHALFAINLPAVGTHHVTVTYPQQGDWNTYTLPVQTFTVTPAPVSISFTPSSWNPTVGTSVTITATVESSSAGSPKSSGSITFYDGNTLLKTIAVNASGTAAYTTSSLTAGSHVITVSYAGGTNYGTGSNSNTIVVAAQ